MTEAASRAVSGAAASMWSYGGIRAASGGSAGLAACVLAALVYAGPAPAADPAAAAGSAGPAQQRARRAAEPAEPGESSERLEEVVVTGTHFRTSNAVSPTPILVVESEELLHTGTSRAEDLLNNLPQLNAGLTVAANAAGVAPLTGTATADLRGIGSFNTLVLMNGRRLTPGDSINPSPDLNTIPTPLVKRVEVLTGGASSIYGSDAISGVVNFVMDTEFTGTRLELEQAASVANNDRTTIQNAVRASGINPPSGSVVDGRTVDASAVYGTNLFGEAGHITVYAGYNHGQRVLGSSRDTSVCTLVETTTSFQCLLDGTTPAGQFVPNGGTGPSLALDAAAGGHSFRPFDVTADTYNPAPFQTLQRPDTRYNAGIFGRYNLTERARAYLEGMFSDTDTSVQYEPSGTTPTSAALNVFNINCNNPLLSASQVAALCTQYGLGPADTAQVGIGRRNVEGGLRRDEFRHRSYRLLLGVKGPINDVWTYDVNGQFGRTDSHERLTNDLSQTKLARALDVVSVGGVPTCQAVVDGTDPSCAPYNIWSLGGVTPAALNYITAGGAQDGHARQSVLDGLLIGELGKYGLRSPYSAEGIDIASGVEYRSQTISNLPNAAYLTGDLLATGAARPTLGTYHVSEVFTELRVPVANDRPFARTLSMNLSDRYAHYSPQGTANAYNISAEWAPVGLLRLRSSLSRAIRAPNGHELFLSQTLSQFPMADPCANDPVSGVPAASPAACALTGVTPAQYGKIPAASAFNQVTGGNPDLKPQIANTFTAGAVLTPGSSFILSADYWRIRVKHYIGSIAAGDTLTNCLATGDPVFCTLIHRDANGSLSVGNGPTAGRVIGTGLNTGSFGMSGVDIEGRYVLPLHTIGLTHAGTVSFVFTGSVAVDNPIEVVPGRAAFDCTGFYGPTCTGEGPTSPIPRWRHKLRATWQADKRLEVSLNWRHIGHMTSEHASSSPHLAGTVYPVDARVGSYDYFDLDAGIDLTSSVALRLGANNILDRKPPVIGYNANPLLVNGNMLATMYDPLGRYLFLSLRVQF